MALVVVFEPLGDEYFSWWYVQRNAAICTGIRIHKQMYNCAKKCVTKLVHAANTSYFGSKIRESLSCKQMFNITNQLLGNKKTDPFQQPSLLLKCHNAFLNSFTEKCKLSEIILILKHRLHPVMQKLASVAGLTVISNLSTKNLSNDFF